MRKFGCFLLLLFTAIACNKNNEPPEYYGSASMLVNGVLWETDKVRCGFLSITCYNGKLELDLRKFGAEGYLREIYSFTKILPAVGVQKIYPINFNNTCNDTLIASCGTLIDDGDVVADVYETKNADGDYFNVEHYDASTKVMDGSFAVTFVVADKYHPDAADTLKITNGKFSTKVLN